MSSWLSIIIKVSFGQQTDKAKEDKVMNVGSEREKNGTGDEYGLTNPTCEFQQKNCLKKPKTRIRLRAFLEKLKLFI